MGNELDWLWALVAACGGAALFQVLWYRMRPSAGLYRSLLAGVLGGLAVGVIISLAFLQLPLDQQVANGAIYICFSYVYFHFLNMGETARRIRLVIELSEAPEGLTEAEWLTRYSGREVLERRLARLEGSGQIVVNGTRIAPGNASVFLMARIIAILKRMLNGPAR